MGGNISLGLPLFPALGRVILVRFLEELDEEEEIRGKETTAEVGRLNGPGAVGLPKALIKPKADAEAVETDSDINHKLNDLHRGEILLPPDLDPKARHEVVIVLQINNTELNQGGSR